VYIFGQNLKRLTSQKVRKTIILELKEYVLLGQSQ
jgi:hypothetical protein